MKNDPINRKDPSGLLDDYLGDDGDGEADVGYEEQAREEIPIEVTAIPSQLEAEQVNTPDQAKSPKDPNAPPDIPNTASTDLPDLCASLGACVTAPPSPDGYEQCVTEALPEVVGSGETPNEPNSGYGSLAQGTVYSAPYPLNIFNGQHNVVLDPSWVHGHPGIQVQ